MSILEKGDRILFQGDSITDCGRDRHQFYGMGNGYALMASAQIGAARPDLDLEFINRGVSGSTAIDMLSRLESDFIELKPTLLSILIGINDTWRAFDANSPTSTEEFADSYHQLLSQVVSRLNPKLVICEPFVLPHPADRKAWRTDLDPKIQVARQMAIEFNATYVPFDGIFAQATCEKNAAYWANDGVHPTSAGHALMADAWISAVSD